MVLIPLPVISNSYVILVTEHVAKRQQVWVITQSINFQPDGGVTNPTSSYCHSATVEKRGRKKCNRLVIVVPDPTTAWGHQGKSGQDTFDGKAPCPQLMRVLPKRK